MSNPPPTSTNFLYHSLAQDISISLPLFVLATIISDIIIVAEDLQPCSRDFPHSYPMDPLQPYDSAISTGIRTIASSSGAKIITKEDWVILKPRIEDLYLRENQAFPKVKEALEEEFGFSIT
jgi:hypothetical protein